MTMVATAMKAQPAELPTRSLKDGFAVEILGLDLPTASEAELQAFDAIVKSNPVVVVRNQKLTPAQVMQVSQRLGKVSAQHRTGPHPEFPGISILSNKKVDGKLIGVRDAGRSWHTDGTTYATLGLTTMLYGIECPPEGAETLIADAAAAFEALPAERQAELEKIQVVHSRAHLIQKYNRAALSAEDLEKMKDVIHPVVVRSPIDGRKAFFVTNGSTKSVVGMTQEDGMALIGELIRHTSQDQFVYPHKWQAGDVLIWNDMCTLHKASPYDEEKYERLVYRTWMRPFEVAGATSALEESMAHH
jgi:taurine dioxygenase